MRHLRLVLVACLLAPSVGCDSLRDWKNKTWPPKGNGNGTNTGAIPPVSAEQLVGYLNTQATRLQTVSYGVVTVNAKEGDDLRDRIKSSVYPTLDGSLSASQPRNFRMTAKNKLGNVKVDLGSNPQQFWVYFLVPTMDPTYVFASHHDFQEGKAKLPGGIPFEPEWVLQAMGMTTFPVDAAYEEATVPGNPSPGSRGPLKSVPINEKDRTYTLRWPATMPNGVQVRKEIVFAVDDADAAREQPQVRKHLIRDMKGKVLCSAEVKSAKTFPTGGTDPQTNRPHVAQYPTQIVLRWEEQKFEMTLRLDGAKVNQQLTQNDVERLFNLPNIPGANPVDLAHARFDSLEGKR